MSVSDSICSSKMNSCNQLIKDHSSKLKIVGITLIALSAITLLGGLFLFAASSGFNLAGVNAIATSIGQPGILAMIAGSGALLILSTALTVKTSCNSANPDNGQNTPAQSPRNSQRSEDDPQSARGSLSESEPELAIRSLLI